MTKFIRFQNKHLPNPNTPLSGPGKWNDPCFAKIPAVFQAVVVENKAFDDEFFQGVGCPYPKPCCLCRIYPIAYRNYGIEVVILSLSIFQFLKINLYQTYHLHPAF